MTARVSIQTGDFKLSDEIAALRANDRRVGAVCSFVGTVRDHNVAPMLGTDVSSRGLAGRGSQDASPLSPVQACSGTLGAAGSSPSEAELAGGGPSQRSSAQQGEVLSMELEHYPGMTEKAIEAMIDEAFVRFDIYAARVIHRVGLLQPLDQVVMVAVTSSHRGESFKACEFLMDYLKTQAPFWKKEQTPEGARWVDARSSDDAALAKWGISAPNA